MNYNDFIIYSALGDNGYRQYRQYADAVRAVQVAQKEREREKLRAMLTSIGSVLFRSIEPTAEFYQKWHEADSRHPNIERGFAAVEYAVNVGEIAYDEYANLDGVSK
ncbi:MAG: hypothetical protein FWH04_07260 [Oscillospiraceae bacterium]|nr:hypothetical protein [Oscillospiraceae bacterium]